MRLNCENRNNGDITSLLYRGTQYQASEKGTQINSGLG
jgi:Rhamnogalacturonan lyase B, N-terminal